MTITAELPFLAVIPPDLSNLTGGSTSATVGNALVMTFDGSGDKLAWVGRIPVSGTITEMLFRTGTVSTAGATFRMRIETVDSSGLPTGTLYTANAEGTVSVATSDDNVVKTVSINSGSGVSVTKNDLVAVVLDVSSGTPNTVQISSPPTWMLGQNFPYIAVNTSGSWAKLGASTLTVPFILNYGGTFVAAPCMNPASGVASQTIGNGNERALRFNVPFPLQIVGAKIALCNVAAGADFTVFLTDSSGTTIWSQSYDGDLTLGTNIDGFFWVTFDQPYDIDANTTYYISVKQDTANNLALFDFSVATAVHMAAAPGGAEFYLGTRTGAGAFSDTTSRRPLIHLMVGGFDDGTGDGGSSTVGTTKAVLPAGLGAMG